MQSLILGGLFGAMGGIIFALSKQSVNPDDYATKFTFTALAVLILGGTARVLGPVIGAINAGYLPDWLIDSNKVGALRFIVVGVAIVLLMIYRPQGIIGDRREVAI